MERVILDRSIFHRDKFTSLQQSPLSSLVARNVLRILYTSAFIEETLMFAIRNPQPFLEQWHYIVSLNHTLWFQTPERILPIELGRKTRRDDFYFVKPESILKVLYNAPKFASRSVPQQEINATLNEVKRNYEIRDDFRTKRLKLRDEYPQANYNFDDYFEANTEWLIKDGLMKYHKNSRGYLTVWQNNRSELNFTEKYLRGWFSTMFIPLIDHKVKVDKNDRIDAAQLAYLEWADTFVSDDLGFLPRAFRLLYPNGDKTLMTSQEFIQHIESLI